MPSPLPACKASTAGRIASSMVRSPAPAPLYRETAAAPAAAAAAQPDGAASPAEQPPQRFSDGSSTPGCRLNVHNKTPASRCLHQLCSIIPTSIIILPAFASVPRKHNDLCNTEVC